MGNHIHSDVLSILIYGASAILVINLVRLGAAKLTEYRTTETFGRVAGSLVHFGG